LVGGAVKAVRVAVHVARVEVAVQVEGSGDTGMAHDLLQHLGRVPSLDHQRGSRVPEIVNAEPGTYTCLGSGSQEHFSPPVGQTEKVPATRGEYKLVGLELGLSIDIARDGSARVLYQHDLVNLNEKPLSRVTREVWFQYVDTSITITPTQHNDRRIVIQRIHDAGSLAKFAFKISPPLQPGERTTVRYLCEGGSFRDALYWHEFMTRYTRHYTFTLRHQGIGKLTDCTAVIEHSDGSETSVTEGLLWDYDGDDVTVTAAVDYLRPGQTVELRWDADRATTR